MIRPTGAATIGLQIAACSRGWGTRLQNTLIVAIVDDDESVRLATSRLVRSLGWEVRPYDSARAFLDSGRIGEADCVITDFQMPGMTGLEMQRTLTARHYSVPVIFITAYCTDAVRRQALDSGAMSVLPKPVDGASVKACLERVALNAG
ncbi:response regulator [Cupriavidus plantarum]|uniref:Response regulator receiver domain-containing protein n=1 Tax=Cupriavidus plantarum TaxID=942865 RepID=A0A316ESA5_9BURK|nr:response regulator receiver domain-containing protein [Cupriavidus plantarum]REE93539.1 response regulator receiver domain-containing protein [Cupriavidus plantarum]RLK38961.1 response regulator receiver domain-containing protein [Cupriavidus plantarum]CAG2136227.1 Sensor histidine kinase RcsC [Cupriavidus plantarum]SMR84709.1 Response regulator receiver domain-containing protein [Cupriavidus plantarum]